MTRLAILLSGRGSNFLALHHAIHTGEIPNAEIALVLSNRAQAPGLAAARALGLPALHLPTAGLPPEQRDAPYIAALQAHRIDLICLAGYMRLLSPAFIAAFPHRILNIHPSLLPAFPGLEAQTQALEYGAKVSGCTVHFVDEHLDHGAIILQRPVPVLDDDTPATLSARILAEEHLAYPEALRRVFSGRYTLEGRRFILGTEISS